MNFFVFKMALRLLLLGLAWFLTLYWGIFISYTTMHLVTGGPSAVVGWYKHISGAPFQHWSWGKFLAGQIAIFAITLALCYFEWRRLTQITPGTSARQISS